ALRYVALPRRGAADNHGCLEGVHARVAGPAAVIGCIVVTRAPLRRARAVRRHCGKLIRRTGARTPRAALPSVALPRRGAADDGSGLEGVHARVTAPQAMIVRVVVTRAPLRRARAERRRCGKLIRRTGARTPRAALRYVALARGGPAHRACALELA